MISGGGLGVEGCSGWVCGVSTGQVGVGWGWVVPGQPHPPNGKRLSYKTYYLSSKPLDLSYGPINWFNLQGTKKAQEKQYIH